MSPDSRSDCRERAVYWALRADERLTEMKLPMLELASKVMAAPSAYAALATAWATLALSANQP